MASRKPKATDLTVEFWPIERPTPYARNARIAPEAAVAKVAASIKEFGWRSPIVVDEQDVILAGHTRLLAARRLGLDQVPIHVAVGLTAAQARAFRLMDNRSAQETSWDPDLLPLELQELNETYRALTGFEPDEIAEYLATPTEGRADPDEIVEPPANPMAKLGDLYLLGKHRLLCGDSTDPEQVRRLMAGERASLMFTDPPYLVDYDGGNHPQSYSNKPAVKEKHWGSYTDPDQASTFFRDFLVAACAEALAPSAAVYQCFGMMRVDLVMAAWREAGLLLHQVVIWKKSRPVLTRCWFMYDFEPIMAGWQKGNQPKAKPPNNERCVWEIGTTEGVEDGVAGTHPTIKPVELVRRPITWHTKQGGGLLYEPFSGSGTAIIAAEQTARRCYAMELSPGFVDATVLRWERFTGERAVLEAHGPD